MLRHLWKMLTDLQAHSRYIRSVAQNPRCSSEANNGRAAFVFGFGVLLSDSVNRAGDKVMCAAGLRKQFLDDLSGNLAVRLHLPGTIVTQPDIRNFPLMELSRIAELNLSAEELSVVWMTRNGTGGVGTSVGHGVEPLF